MKKTNLKTKQKGFTLLFAVLVTVLIVSISATIIFVSTKQVILSGTSRESQYAFYAANTALECAFYWDIYHKDPNIGYVFPADGQESISVGTESIKCADVVLVIREEPPSSDTRTHTFSLQIDHKDLPSGAREPTPGCADVTVIKQASTIDVGGNHLDVIKTRIESKGRNRCGFGPRTVERGLILEYQI